MLNVASIFRALSDDSAERTSYGNEAALERVVTSVSAIASAAEIETQPSNSLVIVPREISHSGDVGLEILLRRAASAHVSCIIVEQGTGAPPTSTLRLAERFNIALWCPPYLDASIMRARIDDLVRNPEMIGSGIVRTVIESMRHPASSFGEIVDRAAKHLDCPVGLLGSDGSSIAGPPIFRTDELVDRLAALNPSPIDLVHSNADGQQIFLVPAFPLVPDGPHFWLAAITPPGAELRTSYITASLRAAALALSALLSRSSLAYERDNRSLRALFDEFQTSGGALTVEQIEHATAFGWRLFGWHAAVQMRSDSSLAQAPLSSISYACADALRRHGVRMRPLTIESTLIFWESWIAPPPADELDALESKVTTALREVELAYPGVRMRAGVGTPRNASTGIPVSISEARSALASAEAERGSESPIVRRADHMTAHRLIERWLPDSATRDAIIAQIEPLQRADSGEQLIQTLRTYLDLESNASATAAALHVHRNTVLQRLQRIRSLITVDLDDPSNRLTVQLALRLLNA